MDSDNLDSQLNSLQLDPQKAGDDLVRLVLALTNVIRELMEKQALRRIEQGKLPEDKIEDVGCTLLALEEKMDELKRHFNLTSEDLEIDLKRLIKVDPE